MKTGAENAGPGETTKVFSAAELAAAQTAARPTLEMPVVDAKQLAKMERLAADEARGKEALKSVGTFFSGLWNRAKAATAPAREALSKVPGAAVKGGVIGVGMGIRGVEAGGRAAVATKDHLTKDVINRSEVVGAGIAVVAGAVEGVLAAEEAYDATKDHLTRDVVNRSEVIQGGKYVAGKTVEGAAFVAGAAVAGAEAVAGAVDRSKKALVKEGQAFVREVDNQIRNVEAQAKGVIMEAQAKLNGVRNVFRAASAVVGEVARVAGEVHQAGKQETYAKQWEAHNQQMDAQWDGYMTKWGSMSEGQRQTEWAGMNPQQQYNLNAAYQRATQRAAAEHQAVFSALNEFDQSKGSGSKRGAATVVGGGMA